jgi:2-dehydro-3-deoxyphosphogluconate aldolase/(4S)-4-hydroxy-2-oxoglutarate aldolase
VATPSDIEAGLALGCKTLKFFPAGQLGGAAMVKALSGPYRHTGVKFVPTGGVKPDNLEEYLRLDTVAACGGTWLAKKEIIAAGDWHAVTQACREAVAIVAKARG